MRRMIAPTIQHLKLQSTALKCTGSDICGLSRAVALDVDRVGEVQYGGGRQLFNHTLQLP
eukprot:COSAG02_NODE_49_length_45106_cov_298.436177_6_plen_60_part_00